MRLRRLDEHGGVGFAVFILIFLAYAIISVVYFEAIRVDSPQDEAAAETSQEVPEIIEGPETPLPKGTTLNFTGDKVLTLLTNSDVKLLPENTPSKFVNHLTNTLPGSLDETNPGCVNAYQITKISNFNVAGSIAEIDTESKRGSDSCSRGLSVVWYLEEASWDWVSKNFGALPFCDDLAELPIYSEFISQCISRNTSSTVANPNGSIKDR